MDPKQLSLFLRWAALVTKRYLRQAARDTKRYLKAGCPVFLGRADVGVLWRGVTHIYIAIVKDDRRFEICLQQIVRVKRKPLSLLCVIENPHDVHTILGIYNSC